MTKLRQRLTEGACMVVIVPLSVSSDDLQHASQYLDVQEQARAERFVTADLQRRFRVCRGRLRMLLGALLEESPKDIVFHYGSRGKPFIKSTHDLRFNVSHSEDWALMAFSLEASIGIDFEFQDRRMDDQAIASQLLNEADFASWRRLPEPDQHRELLSLWVAKEAILKAMGIGISESLRRLVLPIPISASGFSPKIETELLDQAKRTGLADSTAKGFGERWQLSFLDAMSNATAAICHEASVDRHTIHRWEEIVLRR